jgi:plastocyanin
MMRSLLPAAAVGLMLAAPACLAGETVEIGIVGYKFVPAELKVSRGTTVTWINKETRTSHSVLFLEPGAAESDRLFPGESHSRTFDKPGSYPYRCGPHEEMRGLIEVAD